MSAALALLMTIPPAIAGEVEWKILHDQAAGHLQRGGLEQAERFARAALQEAETTLAPGNRAIDQSLSTLALALRLQGKQAEALPFAERLVEIRTRRDGAQAASTGVALHNEAEVLIALDRMDDAAKMQARALAVFERRYGEKHINTATALHNMGAILLKEGRNVEAEQYLRRALAAKYQVLDRNHLSVAHTLDNLAAALDAQGRQIEAERYKRRAENIRRRAQAAKSGN